jgi:HK97 family phage major capsid protein
MIKRKIAEYRTLPTNEKALEEKRTELLDEMTNIVNGAETEIRTLTDEEEVRYDEIKKEISKIDKTLEIIEEQRAFNKIPAKKSATEESIELEERAFANYIRGVVETRTATNLTASDNGAVIPKSIAQKIIKKVYDISPIYQLATRYNVKGDLTIPYYDETSSAITTAYATEFTDLESTSGKFKSIELKGFLAGALTKVSVSLLNNSTFDLLSFVITAMAESIAKFIEKELLKGTSSKITGLSDAKQKVIAASATALVADELIDVQELVPDVYQAGAIWIMNKATRTAIRKLKDNDGNYLLNKDISAKWGYTLLGKDVYTSDNMDTMEADKTAIFYGNMSGLAVKLSEDANIQVLREKYATQHALGVVGWVELDSKIEDEQKIARLVMASA